MFGENPLGIYRVGLALYRSEIRLAVVARPFFCKRARLALAVSIARAPNESCEAALRKALWHPAFKARANEFKGFDLALALSPGDLACAECLRVPFRSEREIEAVAGSLAESHCAGESAEELAVETYVRRRDKNGARVEVVALRREALERILAAAAEAAPASNLKLVTSIPSALAHVLPVGKHGALGVVDCSAGEGLVFSRETDGGVAWRSFPFSSVADQALRQTRAACESLAPSAQSGTGESECSMPAHLTQGEGDCVDLKMERAIEVRYAAAAAVLLAHRGGLPNLLRDSSRAPKGWSAKLRRPLLAACACAALALLTAGLHFEKMRLQSATALARCIERERTLGLALKPGEALRGGTLAARMKLTLAEEAETRAANRAPSALAFWCELAAAMPNPDELGLTLETLQLGPGEGRLSGRVSALAGDPLAHAGRFEKALNTAGGLSARAEFETREQDLLVRMRLDYRPSDNSPDAARLAHVAAGGQP